MTNFTHIDGVPNPPNAPSTDVASMQINTNSISGIIATDHIGFNLANGGAHDQVQLANVTGGNGTLPIGLIGNGFETLYASATVEGGTFGTAGELWFVRGSTLTGIQLTGPGTPTVSGNFGYTFLPGGILIQWGKTTASGTGTRNYLFTSNAPGFAFPNACFQVIAQTQITTIANGIDWTVSNISTTGFSLGTLPSGTPSGTPFSWFAIGN